MKKFFKFLLYILVVLALFLGLLFFKASSWYEEMYAGVPFSQLLYHIFSPLEGTDTGFLNGFVSRCLPLPCIVTIIAIIVIVVIEKKVKKTKVFTSIIAVVSVICLAIGGTRLYKTMGIEEYIETNGTSTDFYEKYYVDPSKNVEFTYPEEKRNLIYIFLESMEVTYESQETGGLTETDYIPELTQLQEENLTFNGDDPSCNGFYVPSLSAWTVAGIVGQTCGTPVNTEWKIKNNITEGDFLPNATAIGEILDKAGYNQEFMCGSEIEFGGRLNYLNQHGNYRIFDYNYAIENEYIPSNYGVWWGFEDSKLFNFAKEELNDLGSKDAPFNLTLLTADTHFPDGYDCKECEHLYDQPYSNVMACSSKQVAAFVEWCKTQEWYDNTTIVIAGDHTTMETAWFADKPTDGYDRKAYYTIINPGIEPIREDGRQICTYDLFPTTVAALNIQFNSDRLAFGTNLFGEADTLIEEMGFDTFNAKIQQSSDYYTDYLFGGRDVNKDLAGTERAEWTTKDGESEEEAPLPQFFNGTYNYQTGVVTPAPEGTDSNQPIEIEPVAPGEEEQNPEGGQGGGNPEGGQGGGNPEGGGTEVVPDTPVEVPIVPEPATTE